MNISLLRFVSLTLVYTFLKGAVTTFAGSGSGIVDGVGTAASLYSPRSVAVDINDNIYFLDRYNYYFIRKITTAGSFFPSRLSAVLY